MVKWGKKGQIRALLEEEEFSIYKALMDQLVKVAMLDRIGKGRTFAFACDAKQHDLLRNYPTT